MHHVYTVPENVHTSPMEWALVWNSQAHDPTPTPSLEIPLFSNFHTSLKSWLLDPDLLRIEWIYFLIQTTQLYILNVQL